MTALLIFGIFSVIVILGFAVSITVLISRSLSRSFSTIDSMSARNVKQLDSVLNRLMTIKWEDFAAIESVAADIDEGGFYAPQDQTGEVEIERGRLMESIRRSMSLTPDEQMLLDEDFPMGEPS